MNEHGFIKAVHGKLPADLISWKIHDKFAGGVPDAFYAGRASTLFIEYKYVPKLPAKNTTVLKTSLSAQQKLWLDRYYSLSQKCAVIIGCEKRAIILTKGAWHETITKEIFEEHAIDFSATAQIIANICNGIPQNYLE